ncbi:MAG: aspartyl protease family protein [Bacteroidia bacterium]|nr:aspartyl protease family protein [Bacteroidia bacterium]
MKSGETKQKHFKVEVPFEMRMGLVVLKVKVNGVDCEYLLDTGAPNVISKDLAKKINLIENTTQKTGDSQGKKSELGFSKIACITIGGIDFLETGTAIADLKQAHEIACLNVEGFIGANLMRKAIWKFDYTKKIITICSSRDSLSIPNTCKKIKFTTVITGTPKIELIYNGISDKDVTLDLGSNGDFDSDQKTLNKLKQAGALKQITYSYGHGGTGLYGKAPIDTTFYALVSNIKCGDIEMNTQIVGFGTSNAKTLGTAYFKNHDLIIDWSKSEILLLEKTSYYNNIKKMRFSLMFDNNKLFVASVDEHSPAEGPKLGDQVISINGRNYAECSPDAWCEILFNNPLKKEAEIALKVLRDEKEYSYQLKSELIFQAQ